MKMVRWLSGVPSWCFWFTRSMWTRRLYTEGGESIRMGRIHIWRTYKPAPTFWIGLHWPWTRHIEPCGCSMWRGSHRNFTTCMGHLREMVGP